jgi:ethanolamine utilization protein EutP (predicted NTPase)
MKYRRSLFIQFINISNLRDYSPIIKYDIAEQKNINLRGHLLFQVDYQNLIFHQSQADNFGLTRLKFQNSVWPDWQL